jgi:AcrR family transcriptional regulator
MAATRSQRYHAGLTPERVIDEALALTSKTHLLSWSIRDLTQRLGVAPSVVYHHVGGKDEIARRVVERVLTDLPWQDWFRGLLIPARSLLQGYPGVAKWLLMHGPTVSPVLPLIDDGMTTLARAGFGEAAGFAYGVLLNNAMLTVSLSEERRQHEDDGPRDHAAIVADLARLGSENAGVQELTRTLVAPFAAGGEAAERQAAEYFRFVVETTIAGLEARLAER